MTSQSQGIEGRRIGFVGGGSMAGARADALTRKYLAARKRHFMVIFGQTISALTVQVVASAVLLGFAAREAGLVHLLLDLGEVRARGGHGARDGLLQQRRHGAVRGAVSRSR